MTTPAAEPRLLIAEDEDRLRRLLEMLLGNRGYRLSLARDGAEALEMFSANGSYDLVITDLRMPRLDGLELLKQIKARSPSTPVMVITAFGTIESAVDAMRAGAVDYITKPFEEVALNLAIERALSFGRLTLENTALREEIRSRLNLDHMVAESRAMREVLDTAQRVAASATTVMIYGESGTGKELVTRAIHEASPRAHGPFVAINCAAIPENLLESELFGHEKGAFSGATDRKVGRFELANGGTLFLDEIGEMSLSIQAKVLRAIELSEFVRVGGTKTLKTDLRIIAATNKDLRRKVADGSFREDLLFRINVFPIVLPPLRERPDDILPLARFFLEKFCREMGHRVDVQISPEAADILLRRQWVGNVRELRNAIERATILLRGSILTPAELALGGPGAGASADAWSAYWGGEHELPPPNCRLIGGSGTSLPGAGGTGILPVASRMSVPGDSGMVSATSAAGAFPGAEFRVPDAGFSLEEHERMLLIQALERAGGNKTRAAKLLGLSRATLRYRLDKFGIGDNDTVETSATNQSLS